MPFGIGINTRPPEHGALLQAGMEVAVQCWFTSTGRPMPQKMKVKTESEEIITIDHIRTEKMDEHWYAGIKSIKFTCNAIIGEHLVPFTLIFSPESCTWMLWSKDD